VVSVETVEADRAHALSMLGAIVTLLADGLGLLAADQGDVLRGVLGGGLTEPGPTPALGAALAALLAACSRARPLVVLVDGAQWADEASRGAVISAARHLDHEAVLLLLAERDGEPNGFARQLPTLEVVGLSPLDAALLLSNDVDTRVAEELGRETGGNPLALVEIAAQLTPEQRHGSVPLDHAFPIGDVLRRGFLARTDELGPDDARAILVASTDRYLDRETLTRAAAAWGIDGAAVDRVMTPTLLQVERSGTIRFAHPLLRVTVYQSAAIGDRRTAHRMVAAVLCRDADTYRRARHLAAAAEGPDPVAADALAAAARGKRDGRAAGETWQRAALLTPDPIVRYERLLAGGSAFADAGENLAAVHLFDDALAIVGDVRRRADVHVRRAMPAVEALGTGGLREQLDELVPLLPPADPRVHVLVAMSGAIAMLQGDFVGARTTLQSESRSAPGPTRTMLDVARLLTGDVSEIGEVVAYANELAADANELAATAQTRFHDDFVVFALIWAGEYSAASRLVDSLVMSRRITGANFELAFALSARAHLYFRTGRWAAARADAEESVELAYAANRPTTLTRSLFVLARIEAGLGDTELAVEHARGSYELGERFGLGSLSWKASAAMGFALLGDGRPAQAVEWLERTHEFARARHVSLLASNMWAPDLVEAYIHCGKKPAAAWVVDELALARPGEQGPLGHALFLRCRALVGGTDAVGDFEAALELLTDVGSPFEEARTRLCLGERVRRDRDVGVARVHLVAAAEAFARLGASDWEHRARREAAACTRGRSSATSGTRVDSLTPQECRVAIEVANGATSREAGAALFLSPRTVEYHLGKIYRKLGLRSRSDLVRRIAGDPDFVGHTEPHTEPRR